MRKHLDSHLVRVKFDRSCQPRVRKEWARKSANVIVIERAHAVGSSDAGPIGGALGAHPALGAPVTLLPKIAGGYPDVVSSGDHMNLDSKAASNQQAGPSSRNDKAAERLFSTYHLKRFFGVYFFPVLIMVGGGVVMPNPDGALFVAVAWMLIAGRYIRS